MYNETTRLVKVVMPDYGQDEPPVNGGGNHPILYSVNQIQQSDPVGGGDIMLSDTAENLFIAYEVVAMANDEETGKTHFSQLKWKKLGTVEDESESESESESEETEPQLVYEFMFESGDLFVAYAADEYPALDGDELQMLSDDSSSGGGSGGSGGGGGVLAVTRSETGVLDHTWKEISEASAAVLKAGMGPVSYLTGVLGAGENCAVVFSTVVEGNVMELLFHTASENGYPVLQQG